MHSPQPGIFALSNPDNDFLELDLVGDATLDAAIRALVNAAEPWSTRGGVTVVLGARPSLWRALAPDRTPQDAADFDEPVVGLDGFTMPATQRDLWVWIAGPDRPSVFYAAMALRAAVEGVAEVKTERVGWHYKESRDLTGFVDGTENPPVLRAADVVTVPSGEPGSGASVLLYQIWEHDIEAWTSLPVKAQEDAIGRTKADDVEMDDAVKPPTAHIARSKVHVDGEEQKIFRRNTAYGESGRHGTLFVGFSRDQFRQAEMLRRMAGVGDGVRDELTRFTTPLTGAFYVVPTASDLAAYVVDED